MSLAALHPPLDQVRAPSPRLTSPTGAPAATPSLRPGRAPRDEHPRIGRELTAVVVDGIARAQVHATAARHLLDRDPAGAADELGCTIACARRALDEMRALVGALRAEPDAIEVPSLLAADPGAADTTNLPGVRATDRRAERARIARDLHDVVGASFAVISVQAGAARVLAHIDPEAARTAVGHVRDAADRALAEVDGLFAPRPQVRGRRTRTTVADAVARARPTRLWIDLAETGDTPIPALVEHAAARIVQEALTNAHEHGDAADPRVRVRVERSAAGLRLTVVNAVAPRAATSARGGGFGVAGMHERARAVGGRCAAGRLADGAWLVRATLPAHAA